MWAVFFLVYGLVRKSGYNPLSVEFYLFRELNLYWNFWKKSMAEHQLLLRLNILMKPDLIIDRYQIRLMQMLFVTV